MKRIMVCDDEPHILEGLRYLLRSPDQHVEVANSGREALQRIAEQKPDLLITDIMMPEMSGLEVVSALRGQEATKDLPIIILTAKGQAQDAAMAQQVWGATVVAKPFKPQELRELVTITLESGVCPQVNSI
jgi:CheY-like chemotaxis protein